MIAGITTLQLDTWFFQTMWLGLAGALLMIYSMYFSVTQKEK